MPSGSSPVQKPPYMSKKTKNVKRTSFNIDADVYRAFHAEVIEQGRTVTEVIEALMRGYVATRGGTMKK